MPTNIDRHIARGVDQLDGASLRQRFLEQDEFIVVDHFLPPDILRSWQEELEILRPHIHRNYIPRHKKGGSVGYETIRKLAPNIDGVYRSLVFLRFIRQLVDPSVKECPESDPHRCALYAYTEPGDHIGFHYDTSYYKDRRFTVLVGLKDQSSSRLVCHLHTRNSGHAVEKLEVQLSPGRLVVFNGDKVYHAVTPLREGEERFVITMEYVTSAEMHLFMRFVSNMKDAIAYFGLREVFLKRNR